MKEESVLAGTENHTDKDGEPVKDERQVTIAEMMQRLEAVEARLTVLEGSRTPVGRQPGW